MVPCQYYMSLLTATLAQLIYSISILWPETVSLEALGPRLYPGGERPHPQRPVPKPNTAPEEKETFFLEKRLLLLAHRIPHLLDRVLLKQKLTPGRRLNQTIRLLSACCELKDKRPTSPTSLSKLSNRIQ